MQKTFFRIKQHRYFLSFILIFAYVQTVQERFSYRKVIDVYLFTPEAAVAQFFSAGMLFLIMRYLLKKWQKVAVIEIKKLVYIFIVSILLYYGVMLLLGLIVAFVFNTFERNFNSTTLLINSFMYALNALIYGSFYLTYFYYRRNKVQQEELTKYNQALSESKILQLKSQINPHFLFNNLNVLDQLIEEDKTAASDFLNNFAELYRVVLEVSDKKLISLNEEIEFAKKYFHLIKQKYGNAYVLEFDVRSNIGDIVPMTFQLLIENVVKHNVGSEQDPIKIKIVIDKNITVFNTLKLKLNTQLSSGKALKNLDAQYKLLSNDKLNVIHNETYFSVTIPIINSIHND